MFTVTLRILKMTIQILIFSSYGSNSFINHTVGVGGEVGVESCAPLNLSNAKVTFVQSARSKILENHLNPVILVFIG